MSFASRLTCCIVSSGCSTAFTRAFESKRIRFIMASASTTRPWPMQSSTPGKQRNTCVAFRASVSSGVQGLLLPVQQGNVSSKSFLKARLPPGRIPGFELA